MDRNEDYDPLIEGEDEDYEQLREKLSKAIQEMDFEYASELQQKLDTMSEKKSDDDIKVFQFELQARCSECEEAYRKAKRKVLRKFCKLEVKARASITDEFIDKQTKHKKQIKALENALFVEYQSRMNKPIPEFTEQIERAKQAASRGEFTDACEMRNEARELQVEELNKRKAEFEAYYKIQINGLLDRQRQELTALTKHLEQSIADLEKQRKDAIDEEIQAFRRSLAKQYTKVKSSVRTNKYTNPLDKKPKSDAASTISTLPPVSAKMIPLVQKDLAAVYKEILKRNGLANMEDEVVPFPLYKSPSKSPSAANSVFRLGR